MGNNIANIRIYIRINRIRLEFKGSTADNVLMYSARINRIRLEFKVRSIFSSSFSTNGINRIRLEFKGSSSI